MPCQWFKSVQTIEVPTGSPNLSFFPSFFFFLQDSSCGLLCNQLCNVWTKLVLKFNRFNNSEYRYTTDALYITINA